MIPYAILNQRVIVKRRKSTGTDSLGNPIYGTPTDGAGWFTVYPSMLVRLAFSSKIVRFVVEGERIQPTGVVYYNAPYKLRAEDRIVTSDGIEYNVISVQEGQAFGGVVSHWEAIIQTP